MVSPSDLYCFQPDYRSARLCLLDTICDTADELIQKQQAFTHPLPGPDHQPLYQDWIWLSKTDTPSRILVLISGTHGVEGFTGSAIQSYQIKPLAELLRQHNQLGVLLVHALNPWGFAWLRRYDHEGIDLNRNFVEFKSPLPENPEYQQIHQNLFCDESKQLEKTLSYWQATLGKEQFATVITKGQYQNDDGLFYGGTAPSWSRLRLEQACKNIVLQHAERIAVIDLHTGLGPYGYDEVINDHQPDTFGFDWACQWYGGDAKSALLGESCSPPKEGLLDYFWHDLINDRGCFVTLEYGTYTLDELLKVSCEEQRYHNSYEHQWQKRDLSHASVAHLRDFFYPQDHNWQEQVLSRSEQVISLAVQGILK